MSFENPRKVTRHPSASNGIGSATAPVVSDPINIEQVTEVAIVVRATGGSVNFGFEPRIHESVPGDVDMSATAVPATNPWHVANVGDVNGELSTELPDAPIQITTAGTFVYYLNVACASELAIALEDPTAGSWAGTVRIDVMKRT